MAINEKIEEIKLLLYEVRKHSDLVIANSFEDATVLDMQQNAKDICDAAKGDIDDIKTEIDTWE